MPPETGDGRGDKVRDGVREADAYLSRVRSLEQMIEFDRERIRQLRAGMDGVGAITYDGPRVKSSPRKDRTEQMIIRLERAVAAYTAHEELLVAEWASILEKIRAMDSPLHSDILTARYLRGQTLARTARELNYAEGYIKRVSAEALMAFYQKFLEEERSNV